MSLLTVQYELQDEGRLQPIQPNVDGQWQCISMGLSLSHCHRQHEIVATHAPFLESESNQHWKHGEENVQRKYPSKIEVPISELILFLIANNGPRHSMDNQRYESSTL